MGLVLLYAAMAVLAWLVMKAAVGTTGTKGAAVQDTNPKSGPQKVSSERMAEDIRATQTSRVVDAVSILDDLSGTNAGYRHYCELVGSSQASSGVTAPYSQRQVAFYDIKCFRIDTTSKGQQETLVAHEHSFDPFFFTDESCDTPVYIDLESFGDNVILVNSTNHIEGPNSEFARSFGRAAQTGSTDSASSGTALAMVGRLRDAACELAGCVLTGGNAGSRVLTSTLRPALASSGVSGWMPSRTSRQDRQGLSLAMDRRPGGGGPGRAGGPGRPGGSGMPGRSPMGAPSHGPGHMPGNLGSFMGPSPHPYVRGGGYTMRRRMHRHGGSPDVLTGMVLGSILTSMASDAGSTTSAQDSFQGYRLVENIVPLGSPIYCIGEIYRHGNQVYMGRSLAKDYPTSFFATKPESEVLWAIGE
jgi:hypothetical protein